VLRQLIFTFWITSSLGVVVKLEFRLAGLSFWPG
jgi:hypothetical protein